jgi:dephospho-CoA kinase
VLNKKIFLLIGQKGSGKSFIGNIFEKKFGIKFIRVEDWVKLINKDHDVFNEIYLKKVFELIENRIREILIENNCIVFESTGLSSYFDKMLESFKNDFQVTTVGIYAERSTCLYRVKSRDQTLHINISEYQISKINKKVIERNLFTDFLIINENKTEKKLINEVQIILNSSI